ncbi:MAG: endonuclease, partial [Verrucomicrobia bacterium]
MKILTCNIRCFGADDGKNGWAYRKGFCIETIRSRTPDIICFQEMWSQQFAD